MESIVSFTIQNVPVSYRLTERLSISYNSSEGMGKYQQHWIK